MGTSHYNITFQIYKIFLYDALSISGKYPKSTISNLYFSNILLEYFFKSPNNTNMLFVKRDYYWYYEFGQNLFRINLNYKNTIICTYAYMGFDLIKLY